jgi:hypothetical protein
MKPANVPVAAALLTEYRPEFEAMEEQASEAVKQIRELARDLK